MRRVIWSVTALRVAIRKAAGVEGKQQADYWVVEDLYLGPSIYKIRSQPSAAVFGRFYIPEQYQKGNWAYPITGQKRRGITIGSLWIRDFLENNPEIKSKVVKYFLMRS